MTLSLLFTCRDSSCAYNLSQPGKGINGLCCLVFLKAQSEAPRSVRGSFPWRHTYLWVTRGCGAAPQHSGASSLSPSFPPSFQLRVFPKGFDLKSSGLLPSLPCIQFSVLSFSASNSSLGGGKGKGGGQGYSHQIFLFFPLPWGAAWYPQVVTQHQALQMLAGAGTELQNEKTNKHLCFLSSPVTAISLQ